MTPGGTVIFNVPEAVTNRLWQITSDGYSIGPTLRVTADNISQQSGSIIHPRFKTGLTSTMHVRYLIRIGGSGSVDYEPACGEDLRIMHETLVRCLDSITDLNNTNQRLIWTPTATGSISRRMLDQIVVSGWPAPVHDGPETGVTFAVESPLPYAIDLTQISTSLGNTIVNVGNTEMWPVVRVNATGAFVITNGDDTDEFGNAKSVVYSSMRPGAVAFSGFAELDFFRGSIFQNGNGADLTAGLDPLLTDFWRVMPGSNGISISGASATMLWNPSWA